MASFSLLHTKYHYSGIHNSSDYVPKYPTTLSRSANKIFKHLGWQVYKIRVKEQLQLKTKLNSINWINLSWLDARLPMHDDGLEDSFCASNSKCSTEEFVRHGAVGGDADKSRRRLQDATSSACTPGLLNSTHDSGTQHINQYSSKIIRQQPQFQWQTWTWLLPAVVSSSWWSMQYRGKRQMRKGNWAWEDIVIRFYKMYFDATCACTKHQFTIPINAAW